jgi:hypothetical protein
VAGLEGVRIGLRMVLVMGVHKIMRAGVRLRLVLVMVMGHARGEGGGGGPRTAI